MQKQENVWNDLYKKGLKWRKETIKLDKGIKGKFVLELGVGNGKTLQTIIIQNPKKVLAIDISKEAINLAKKEVKSKIVTFLRKDFLKFNTKDRFDIIICYYFLNNFKQKQRKVAIEKMKSMLEDKGIILFEDFMVRDYRQKGKEIEPNTIQKSNGIVCHFFTKNEIRGLFKGFDIKIKERTFNPIRTDNSIRRKIINVAIYAPDRI